MDVSAQPVSSGTLAAYATKKPERLDTSNNVSPERVGESTWFQCRPSAERHITVVGLQVSASGAQEGLAMEDDSLVAT